MVRLPSAACSLPLWTSKKEHRTGPNGSVLRSASCACVWKDGRSDESPGDTNSDGLNGHGFPRKHTYKYDEIWWFCMVQRHVYIGEFWSELTIQNLHLEAMNANLKSLVVAVFFQSLLLVGGLEHGFFCSISYMGFHPSHSRTHIFQDGYCTTNQIGFPIPQHNGIPLRTSCLFLDRFGNAEPVFPPPFRLNMIENLKSYHHLGKL